MKKLKKIFAWFSIFSLVLQISSGVFLYRPALSEEEATPTVEPTVVETPVEPQPTSEPTVTETPPVESTPSVEPTPTEEVSPTPTPTIEVTPTEAPVEPVINPEPVEGPNLTVTEPEQNLNLDPSGTDGQSAQLKPEVSTDKADYAPEETVTISGQNFPTNTTLLIKVTRPDGSVVKGDGSFAPGSDEITTDSEGKFTYLYKLDGISGEYKVEVFQGETVLATTNFTDTWYTVESYDSTCTTIKNDFTRGETVCGKGTRSSSAEIRLRFIDPSNTVVQTCTPVNGTLTTCSYILPSDAPFGEWDIEIQKENGDWDTKDTDHFNVTIGWPTSWTTPNSCISDPAGDESPASADLIGTAPTPAAVGFASDANYQYFRQRVDGNPSGPGGFDQYSWVVLFQTSPPSYQYLGSLNGLNEKVQLWENTSPAGPVDFSPLLNDPAETLRWEGPTSTYARITIGGDGKKYVDWAIPISELNLRGITTSTTKYFATSANANNFNKDHLLCYEAMADLSVTKTDNPDPVTSGGTLTYTLSIHNAGPDAASGVIVTDTLPAGYSVTSVTPSQGSCSDMTAPDISCELGTINNGGDATITIIGTITGLGTVTNNTSVSLDTTVSIDTNTSNNTDSEDTTINPAAVCGDGIVNQTSEQCDDGAQNGQVCTPSYGDTCNYCSNSCQIETVTGPYCGDSNVDSPYESCDNNPPQACQTQDGYNGTQACSSCQWDECIPTEYCGDGTKNGPEECDGTDGVQEHYTCTQFCTLEYVPYCGDGIVNQTSEQCDDGNTSNNDSCLNTCLSNICGDGVVQTGVEACDDGNSSNNDACLNTCVVATCGDGFVGPTEGCDAGTENGIQCTPPYGGSCNYCSVSCQPVTLNGPYCGDNIKNGSEACDGNDGVTEHYTCTNDCQLEYVPYCGDNIVNQTSEECDGTAPGVPDHYLCTNTCTLEYVPYCGDGIVNGSEACDDGNTNENDTCNNSCQLTGTITILKNVDTDGDGQIDVYGATDWTWDITGGEQDIATGQSRALITGPYTITEDEKTNYHLVSWSCTDDTSGTANSIPVTLTTAGLTCTFVNAYAPPSISIAKTNDHTGGASAGDTVNYTLTLTNGPVALSNVTVTDVMPSGFVYVAGSGKVDSALSEPTISGNVLTWTLNLAANQVVVITYQAKIDGSQPAGTYYNLATCRGSIFNCDVVDSSVSISVGVSTTTAIGGTVLGVSTVLGAATGSETYWLILAILMILAGLSLRFLNRKKIGKKLAIFAGVALLFLAVARSAQAVVVVKVADLPAYERTDNFKLYYTALDTENPSVSVVAYVKKDGGFGWKTFGGTKTDPSGYFEAFGYDLDGDGTYHFYVQANGVNSSETSTIVDRVAPNGPGDYSKSRESSTSYKIHFKNPGELDYGWTRIFASQTQNFIADDSTKKADVGGGPNQEFNYIVGGLEPDKEYFFALQGFDKAGNGSGLSGDGGTVTYIEVSPTPAPGVAGAEVVILPGEEGAGAGGEILGGATGEPVPTEEAGGLAGAVAGVTGKGGSRTLLLFAGLGILVIIGYLLYRRSS